MGIYGWMIITLAILFIMVMLLALLSAGPRISPDEEARLLAIQQEERRKKLEEKQRAKEAREAKKANT